jgi:hypothetical protein
MAYSRSEVVIANEAPAPSKAWGREPQSVYFAGLRRDPFGKGDLGMTCCAFVKRL